MSDILRDFDKKNEFSRVKIPKFATGGICNDAIFPKGDYISEFEKIAKEIAKRKDNAMAMEFTKCIGELLRKNGVVPKLTEYRAENHEENFLRSKYEVKYGVSIDELDFSEHDKVFEDKIASLEKQIEKMQAEKNTLRTRCMESARDNFDNGIYGCLTIVKYPNELKAENMKLKQRIAELESKETETCEKEPVLDDCRPSIEWYDNRHQSDCIEINRLNTTIDVLIHKVEYLRQFAGLE